MKKYVFPFLLVLAAVSLYFQPVSADNGPHGGFNSPTTDSCSGCHRAHTSEAESLLMVSTANLCETCHGSTASGADTNVWDGIYLQRDAESEVPAEGVVGAGLKGGGFVNALMDTSFAGSAASSATTSAHIFDGSSGIIWGSGAIGSGAGTAVTLDCGNCHNPHGNAGTNGTPTYRILRPVPLASNGSGTEIPDPAAKFYTVSDPNGNYWGEDYGSLEAPLAQWCSECHTRYLATQDDENTDSGDPLFGFRHRSDGSDGVSCMDCHVAHGTTAMMGPNSGGMPWPDGTTSPGGDARSAMLRLDSRGVCVQCHQNP